MGLLSWLGFRKGEDYPNLDALVAALRSALPSDEAVILRYVAVVVVLLGKIATSDGRLTHQEEALIRALLAHVDRLTPAGVDSVCSALKGRLPSMREAELELCYQQLRALCTHDERVQVMRLLAQIATADGALTVAEHDALDAIAKEIGVEPHELAAVERETATGEPPAASSGEQRSS